MKVLHVYRTYFPDPPGGLQEAIRQISLGTQALGADVKIFALSPNPIPREIRFPEANVVRFKSWLAPASCDIGGFESFRRYGQMVDWADIVHFHFPWPFADILRLSSGSTKPAVMTYHSDIVRQKYLGYAYGPLMRRMLGSMSAVVATSPAYARTSEILTKFVRPEKLRVIPLGIADYSNEPSIDCEPSDPPGRIPLSGRPFFLALGVLRYYKGLHTLIAAAPNVDADIVIAGSGPEMRTLRELAREVHATNVVFAGHITHEEKISLLKKCRALVLPSHLRSEAFGMVLVEAAMFAKPMVCCEIGSGTAYVNEHGVTGIVVPPEAPETLAAALRELLCDEERSRRLGMAARERYERLFSGPALGAAYMNLYEEVLRGKLDAADLSPLTSPKRF